MAHLVTPVPPSPERAAFASARRIVVKVGTRVVTRPDGGLSVSRLAHLMEQLADLRSQGVEVILVSSGAIGVGARRLGLPPQPDNLRDRQAAATAGQAGLMSFYDELARRLGVRTAQVLLIEADFHNRRRYGNLSQNLERLLELGAIPVVNENDSVSTQGLDPSRARVFGDNDRLAALVAAALGADLLILLTNVRGVLHNGEVIERWDPSLDVEFYGSSTGGTGGMEAKVASAQVSSLAGVSTVIAAGNEAGTVRHIMEGAAEGTLFPANVTSTRRRRWLAYATAPRFWVQVNEGAERALRTRGASLLPIGITHIHGEFPAGEAIAIRGADGRVFAHGVANDGASVMQERLGQGGHRPAIHRDDVVLLEEGELEPL
ncbi:MAG: glutamate 5-kinase [Myxococcota bacterium]|nr:glutamate 5-kinase [Myxococcota bacterium]